MDSLNPYNPFEGRKKGSRYTQEQLDYIQELLKLNWSVAKICSTFNLNKKAIKKRMDENNWIVTSKRKTPLTNDNLQEIKKMVDNGVGLNEICNKYQISLLTLQNRISNNHWIVAKRKNRYNFNEHYFDVIDNEHKAYWLGFLLADGYVLSKRKGKRAHQSQSFGFAISIKDVELLEKFKEDLEAENPIKFYKNTGSFSTEDSEYGRILLTSQHTVDTLKKYNITENKTFTVKIPDNIPDELMPHLIRGIFDGDGTVTITKNNKYHLGFCGTKEVLIKIQEFFGTNVQLSQRFPERHNNHYDLKYSGNIQIPNLLDMLYKDATIYLTRKYNKYAEMRGIKG